MHMNKSAFTALSQSCSQYSEIWLFKTLEKNLHPLLRSRPFSFMFNNNWTTSSTNRRIIEPKFFSNLHRGSLAIVGTSQDKVTVV